MQIVNPGAPAVHRRNNVHESGQGPRPLVFVHGFGTDQSMWWRVAPAFERTHRVVRFDFVGSGGSDLRAYDPRRYGSLDGYAQDLLDVCEALDLRGVRVVGHSVGGMIGLLAAIRAPDRFDRLVMIGSSPCYVDHPPDYVGGFSRADVDAMLAMMENNFAGWSRLMVSNIMRNDDRPELSDELGDLLETLDPDIARRWSRVVFLCDLRDRLALSNTPTLVLQCRDDMVAPMEVGHYLQQHLRQGVLRAMQATGHCPHMSHPAETIALIADYLDTRLPA